MMMTETGKSGRYLVIDPLMQNLRESLRTIAPTPLPVLILGETGTGKDVAAEWLHRVSNRPPDKFVKVNCASLSESLVESELFGHERGAFTGALGSHEGLLEAADGGTLFLDEVGELSLRTQAKLLRVLESGELLRVGSTRCRHVELRVIAATHRDLRQLAETGEFREDLYFRLNGITLRVPPLRERSGEILPLAQMFVEAFCERLDRRTPELTDAAICALLSYRWPGNIRELRHVVERAAVLCGAEPIRPEHLIMESPADTAHNVLLSLRDDASVREKHRILSALAETRQNQTRAAVLLGVSRRTLTNKLNAYGIARPRKKFSPGMGGG